MTSILRGNKDWALRIEGRFAAGEQVARVAVDYAADVLGRPLLRGAGRLARRPDRADRAAGDRSFDDESVTI